MDELDFTLELLRDKAQLVRSLRKLGYAQGDVGVKPGWLPGSALLLELEEKLLDMFDGNPGFGGGEDNGDVAVGGVVLFDYDVTFCADINLSPVAWGDGECGVHAFTIQVCVRGGKVVSYVIKGRNKNELFVRIMPQGQDVKNS